MCVCTPTRTTRTTHTCKMLIKKGLWKTSVVPEEVHEDVVEINMNNLDVHLETKEEEVKKSVICRKVWLW